MGCKMMTFTWWGLLCITTVQGSFEITQPAHLSGPYVSRDISFGAKSYTVEATVVTARSTLCNSSAVEDYHDQIVLVPVEAAANCTASLAARIISQQHAVAVVFSEAITEEGDVRMGIPCISLLGDANETSLLLAATTNTSFNLSASLVSQHISMLDNNDDAIDCSQFEEYPPLLAVVMGLWGFLLALWVWNTWKLNVNDASSLHRTMTIVPVLKFLLVAVTCSLWMQCPWESDSSPWLFMVWIGLYTWYEASYFALFLLLGRGWCITLRTLQPSDVAKMSSLVCLFYAAVNTYVVVNAPFVWILVVVVYAILLAVTLSHIRVNLRLLRGQLQMIYQARIAPLSTPVFQKYRMFQHLYWVVVAYTFLEIIVHGLMAFVIEEQWVGKLLHESMEMLVFTCIGWKFRAQQHSPYFSLIPEMPHGQMSAPIPMMSTSELPEVEMDQLRGGELQEWKPGMALPPMPKSLPPMLVIQNPGDADDQDQTGLYGYVVGTMQKPVSHSTATVAPAVHGTPPPASRACPSPPPPPGSSTNPAPQGPSEGCE